LTTGIVIFAHGSRVEPANEAVREVARQFASLNLACPVTAGFLELGQPDLDGAVTDLAAKGATRIVVIPYFLTLGLHLERDLPRLLTEISLKHNHLEIVATPPLDGHPALLEILRDRALEAAKQA
jgi:sirohydrochlorin ferrochelatase